MNLIIGLLGVSIVCSTCPKTECSLHSSHLCAVFSEDSVSLSPCLNGDFCDVLDLHSNWQEGKTGLECKQAPDDGNLASIFKFMGEVCKDPILEGKKLVHSHPKRCLNNNDCLLSDGSYAECKCGLSVNGFGFCEVSEGDIIYRDMVQAACNEDLDEFVFRFLKVKFFVFLQDRPACAGFVSEDLAAIDYLFAGGEILGSKGPEESGSFFKSFGIGFLILLII